MSDTAIAGAFLYRHPYQPPHLVVDQIVDGV